MKQPEVIIAIIMCAAALVAVAWLLMKYLDSKSKKKDKKDSTDIEKLGVLLGIEMSSGVTLNGLEFDNNGGAVRIYACLRVSKEYLPNSEMRYDRNAEKTPQGIETALMGKYVKGTLGFDAKRIDYVKKLHQDYGGKSLLTEQAAASCSEFAFVEREADSYDYVTVFVFAIVPDTFRFQ
jgi:hypothetical protein